MAIPTLTEALDNLYTTTWQNMKSEAIDQIFDATPFWFWLRDKGKLKTEVGGRRLPETLAYAKNEKVGFIGKGGQVDMSDHEFLTMAYYNWHYLVAPLVRFGVDDQQNAGKAKIMDLAAQKMANAQESLVDVLETTLFGGAGIIGGAFDGLLHLVQDDPTASSLVGELNQNTYPWWRNQAIDMTGESFATTGVTRMRRILNLCMNNKKSDRPDIILSGQDAYEYYEEAVLDKLQIQNKKMADLGFEHTSFKSIPLVWAPAAPVDAMYFLNTKFLSFKYDPRLYFDMTEWKPIPEQVNDRAAQIITACSFTTNRRRTHGVIYDIDTP